MGVELVVLAPALGEALGTGAPDEDLSAGGWRLEELHGFVNVLGQGHGVGIGELVGAGEFGLDVGRGEFEDLYGGVPQLVAEGLRPGVNGGLGGAVGRVGRDGNKGESGGDGENGGVGLSEQRGQEGSGEAKGAEEVGGDGGFGGGQIVETCFEIFGLHHAGVVDEDVDPRQLSFELSDEALDVLRVIDVEGHGSHAGIGLHGVVEDGGAAAGDDDLIARPMEGLSKTATDTGAAAGDEDSVAVSFMLSPFGSVDACHGWGCRNGWGCGRVRC